MKKIICIFLTLILCVSITACGSSEEEVAKNGGGTQAIDKKWVDRSVDNDDGEIIEIKEKMFVSQINEMYLNSGDYIGKTIKYEGLFDSYTNEQTNTRYNYVIRYGPGCCGTDSLPGFEVTWKNENQKYPENKDWVEATGKLDTYEEGGEQFLIIKLTSLKVKNEDRGLETVTN